MVLGWDTVTMITVVEVDDRPVEGKVYAGAWTGSVVV